MPLIVVVAAAENGVIGRGQALPWRLRTDLRRFRELTWGKPLIMGRKTFESIGKALPGRVSIVLTRDAVFAAEGARRAASFAEACELAQTEALRMGADAVAAVGGAEIFQLAIPRAARLHLTRVHAAPEGDVLLPGFDETAFREISRDRREPGPGDEYPFSFIDLVRLSA
ncbi:MAG: dihydrofolate reductase [Methylobacteriaceae bacterium]|nr:dihydrofolate reductase [Methylobacteriaceae bacterium]